MNRISKFISGSAISISMILASSIATAENKIIGHNFNPELIIEVESKRLKSCDNLCMGLEKELWMLEQLSEFELGQFLLKNKGLNGKWTSYVISEAPNKNLRNPLERWLINDAPTVKATQERFKIFQHQLQKYIKINTRIASIPSGTMDDLLSLNLDGVYDVEMVGIDLDQESIDIAKSRYNADRFAKVEFQKKDAWNLQTKEEFNVVVSNGLNIYEPDQEKVKDLYRQFHNSLKEGGVLITSFLTPPPALNPKSPWRNINTNDALMQKALFSDVLQVGWQSYCTEDEARGQLEEAGFEIVEVIYDKQAIFPTIIAKK